jgi:transcriptional regulator
LLFPKIILTVLGKENQLRIFDYNADQIIFDKFKYRSMYIPGLFRLSDTEEIRELIKENGFGILINSRNGKLCATHLPMLLVKDKYQKDILTGHISKANPQWKEFETTNEVLVIFHGNHSYISSSWYDHENVPTWNYLAVHIYGTIEITEGPELIEELSRMVDKYEASMLNPVSVERMSKNFVESEVKGIVGFKISISEIHGAGKLSQNRDDKNYEQIIDGLENQGDHASLMMAKIMREKRGLK